MFGFRSALHDISKLLCTLRNLNIQTFTISWGNLNHLRPSFFNFMIQKFPCRKWHSFTYKNYTRYLHPLIVTIHNHMELHWKQVYKHACFLSHFFSPLYYTPLNSAYLLFLRLSGKAKCCSYPQGNRSEFSLDLLQYHHN